jgi:hypothetical protein
MSFFDFLKAKKQKLPSSYESMAAIVKFIGVQHLDPSSYLRYSHNIEMANSFSRILASNHQQLDTAFRASLPLPISEGAEHIRKAMESLELSEQKVNWIDAQMTESLKMLLPVVRDKNLHHAFNECKWAIEGAFV